MYERIRKSSPWSPPTQEKRSPFAPRPFSVQRSSNNPPTQQEIEEEALEQDRVDTFHLQLKEKYGTITPAEQERLEVLQAKTGDYWAQRKAIASRIRFKLTNPPMAPNRNSDERIPGAASPRAPIREAMYDAGGEVSMRALPGVLQPKIRKNLPPAQSTLQLALGAAQGQAIHRQIVRE